MKLSELLNEAVSATDLKDEIAGYEAAITEYKRQKKFPMVKKYETYLKQAQEKLSALKVNESANVSKEDLEKEIAGYEAAIKEYTYQKKMPMVKKYETYLKQAQEKLSALTESHVPSISMLDETIAMFSKEILVAKRNFEFLSARVLESHRNSLESQKCALKLSEATSDAPEPTAEELDNTIKSYKKSIELYTAKKNKMLVSRFENLLKTAEKNRAKLDEAVETVRDLDGEILGYKGAIKEQKRLQNARMVAKYEDLLKKAEEKRAELLKK